MNWPFLRVQLRRFFSFDQFSDRLAGYQSGFWLGVGASYRLFVKNISLGRVLIPA